MRTDRPVPGTITAYPFTAYPFTAYPFTA